MNVIKVVLIIMAIAVGIPMLFLAFLVDTKWSVIALAIIAAALIITSAIKKSK